MIEYPQIDRYAHLNSFIHELDPRAKIVSFLFLIFSVALVPSLKVALVGLAGSISLLILSKLPFDFVIQYLKWVVLFILFFMVIMPFSVEGKKIFSFYSIKITHEGLTLGLLISIRAISAIILIFPMMGTTKFEESLKALYKLKFPNTLIQIIMFSYRYIFTFLEELQTILRAMQVRGFKPGTNLYTLQVLGKALGMLFVRGYERAERVYQAMQSRGYSENSKILTDFKMNTRDYALASCIVGFGIFLQVIGHFLKV